MLLATAVMLLFGGLAHADPVAMLPSAVDTAWDSFVTSGPYWGGILVVYLLLQTFLSKQHVLAQGRLLALLTGGSMILTAIVQWHWSGAPSAGILTAVMAAFTLVLHPTPAATRPAAPGAKGGGTAAMLAVLLLGGLAAGTSTGCAASSRDTAINTASVAINAVASGELAYDRQHQDALAVQGTPEQAAAALKAYRAKRAKFDKALAAAVDALIVAVKLNDQPSLDGLSAAVVEVITDYQALKGAK